MEFYSFFPNPQFPINTPRFPPLFVPLSFFSNNEYHSHPQPICNDLPVPTFTHPLFIIHHSQFIIPCSLIRFSPFQK